MSRPVIRFTAAAVVGFVVSLLVTTYITVALIAGGFLKHDEGAAASAERLLFRGLHALRDAPGSVRAVDATQIRAAAERLLVAIRRGDPADARALAAA